MVEEKESEREKMCAEGHMKLAAYQCRGNKVRQAANRIISLYTFERIVTE
jgi:hypothetical protein